MFIHKSLIFLKTWMSLLLHARKDRTNFYDAARSQ